MCSAEFESPQFNTCPVCYIDRRDCDHLYCVLNKKWFEFFEPKTCVQTFFIFLMKLEGRIICSVVHSIFLKNWTGRFVTSNIQLRNLWSAVAEPTSVAETGPMLAMLHACIPGPLTCQVPSAEWFLLAWSNSSTHGAFCWSWIVSK